MSYSNLQQRDRTSSGGSFTVSLLGSSQDGGGGSRRSRSLDLSSSSAGDSSAHSTTSRRLDKNLLMRSKMAAPPSSMTRKGSLASFGSTNRIMCSRLNNSNASLCRLNGGGGGGGGSIHSNYSSSNCRLNSNTSMNRIGSSYASCHSSVASTLSQVSSANSSTCSSIFRNGNSNVVVQVAQRSNGSAVKQVIQELSERILEKIQDEDDVEEDGDDDDDEEPPVSQLAMLAQWASVDAYYKVVIAKYDGIPVIIRAMRVYQDNVDVQSYGCMALQHLNNKVLIQQHGGVSAMIVAMRNHSTNISVQSEALQAIQRQGPKLLGQDMTLLKEELLPALDHAKDMFLTKAGKDACLFLLQLVRALLTTSNSNTSPTTVRECVSSVDLGIATST